MVARGLRASQILPIGNPDHDAEQQVASYGSAPCVTPATSADRADGRSRYQRW